MPTPAERPECALHGRLTSLSAEDWMVATNASWEARDADNCNPPKRTSIGDSKPILAASNFAGTPGNPDTVETPQSATDFVAFPPVGEVRRAGCGGLSRRSTGYARIGVDADDSLDANTLSRPYREWVVHVLETEVPEGSFAADSPRSCARHYSRTQASSMMKPGVPILFDTKLKNLRFPRHA